MRTKTLEGRLDVEVFTTTGQTQQALRWFEHQRQDGTLTVYMEIGRVRIYTKRSGQLGKPVENTLNPAQLAQYRTPEYAWNNGQ
jgi:hypothetical protein